MSQLGCCASDLRPPWNATVPSSIVNEAPNLLSPWPAGFGDFWTSTDGEILYGIS